MAVRVLQWLLAAVFVAAGIPKILGVAAVAENFQHFGYSPAFRLLIGALEIAGGVTLLVPAVALYAALLLIGIMAGAVWTVWRVGDSVAPPLIVGALLAVLAVMRLRQTPRQ
jgi:putative oxidoreductase